MITELLAPPIFLERVLTGLLVGGSNAALLAVLFRLTRLRSPRIRRGFITFALLHVVLSVCGFFPLSWIQIGFLHEPTSWFAPWVPILDRGAMIVVVGIGALLALRHLRRERRGRAILEGWLALGGADGDPHSVGRVEAALERIDPLGKHPVKIAVVPLAVTPCIVGSRAPILLAPSPLFDQLTDAELDAVIAHEYAHVVSSDVRVRRLLDGLTILFWFDPFMRRFAHGIQLEGEKLRDADAAERCGRGALGRALLKTFDLLAGSTRTPAIACTPWVGRGFRSVRSRLRALATPPASRPVLCGQLLAICCFLPMPTMPAIHATTDRTPGGEAPHAEAAENRAPTIGPRTAMVIRPVPRIGTVGESCSISIGLRAPNPWLSRAALRLLRSVGVDPRLLGAKPPHADETSKPSADPRFDPSTAATKTR